MSYEANARMFFRDALYNSYVMLMESSTILNQSRLILVATLVLALLGGSSCSRSVSTRQYSRDFSEGTNTSSVSIANSDEPHNWTVASDGDVELLSKTFESSSGPQGVHSLGLESCGLLLRQDKYPALVRQLFSGFQRVQVLEIERPDWMPEEISIAEVSAELEGERLTSIVFSQVQEDCLIEQAFWSNSESDWLHQDDTAQLLYSELLKLPPWNERVSTAELKRDS